MATAISSALVAELFKAPNMSPETPSGPLQSAGNDAEQGA